MSRPVRCDKGGTKMKTGIARLLENGVLAILRGVTPDDVVAVGRALQEGGVTSMEITMDSPHALKAIERAAEAFGDAMWIGAGTVLDAETARAAILAGAEWIVSPALNVETIRVAKRYGKAVIPGVLTPTEMLQAYEAGADAVKIFPAGTMGPAYIKEVSGPLPHIPKIPTGGITLETAPLFIRAGAAAVGIGGALYRPQTFAERGPAHITETARKFVAAVRAAREEIEQ